MFKAIASGYPLILAAANCCAPDDLARQPYEKPWQNITTRRDILSLSFNGLSLLFKCVALQSHKTVGRFKYYSDFATNLFEEIRSE